MRFKKLSQNLEGSTACMISRICSETVIWLTTNSVTAAGITLDKPFLEHTWEEASRLQHVNVKPIAGAHVVHNAAAD